MSEKCQPRWWQLVLRVYLIHPKSEVVKKKLEVHFLFMVVYLLIFVRKTFHCFLTHFKNKTLPPKEKKCQFNNKKITPKVIDLTFRVFTFLNLTIRLFTFLMVPDLYSLSTSFLAEKVVSFIDTQQHKNITFIMEHNELQINPSSKNIIPNFFYPSYTISIGLKHISWYLCHTEDFYKEIEIEDTTKAGHFLQKYIFFGCWQENTL